MAVIPLTEATVDQKVGRGGGRLVTRNFSAARSVFSLKCAMWTGTYYTASGTEKWLTASQQHGAGLRQGREAAYGGRVSGGPARSRARARPLADADNEAQRASKSVRRFRKLRERAALLGLPGSLGH